MRSERAGCAAAMLVTTPSGTSRPSWVPSANSRMRESRPIRVASPRECSWMCRVASARAFVRSTASASRRGEAAPPRLPVASRAHARGLCGRYRGKGSVSDLRRQLWWVCGVRYGSFLTSRAALLSAVLMRAQVTAVDHACLVVGRLRVARGTGGVVPCPQMFQRDALRLMCRSWRLRARASERPPCGLKKRATPNWARAR